MYSYGYIYILYVPQYTYIYIGGQFYLSIKVKQSFNSLAKVCLEGIGLLQLGRKFSGVLHFLAERISHQRTRIIVIHIC